MSAEIVPAANMAELDTLDTEAREVAITGMLDQAKTWLAHAVESTAPAQDINQFRQFIATAAETAKRLKVSKEIQQDAQVMVRRSERALGQAIRTGQENGEIADRHVTIRSSGSDRSVKPISEYVPEHEWRGNGAGIRRLTDDVSDEQFEEAIDRAEEEQNVSRANVVRKVQDVKKHVSIGAHHNITTDDGKTYSVDPRTGEMVEMPTATAYATACGIDNSFHDGLKDLKPFMEGLFTKDLSEPEKDEAEKFLRKYLRRIGRK